MTIKMKLYSSSGARADLAFPLRSSQTTLPRCTPKVEDRKAELQSSNHVPTQKGAARAYCSSAWVVMSVARIASEDVLSSSSPIGSRVMKKTQNIAVCVPPHHCAKAFGTVRRLRVPRTPIEIERPGPSQLA